MVPVPYCLRNGGATISTAITILQLKAGTNYPLEVYTAVLTQTGSVTSAQVHVGVLVKTVAATVTAAVAGTTLTKVGNHGITCDASLGTAATGLTGSAEGTDGEIIVDEGANVVNGQFFVPLPEGRIMVPVGTTLALKFLSAPASHSWRANIYFREIR